MKKEHINEIKAIIILAIGMLLLASLVSFVPEDLPWYTSTVNVPAKNLVRITGAYIAGSLLFVFGYSAYFLVLFLLIWSWRKFSSQEVHSKLYKVISFVLLFSVLSALFGMTASDDGALRFNRAGIIGLVVSDFMIHYLGRIGTAIVLLTLSALALNLTGEFLLSPVLFKMVDWGRGLSKFIGGKVAEKKPKFSAIIPKINIGLPEALKKTQKTQEPGEEKNFEPDQLTAAKSNSRVAPPKDAKPKIRIAASEDEQEQDELPKMVGEYHLPSLDLLDDPPQISTNKIQTNLMSGAKLLEQTLSDFGVSARVADIERGPAITRYELEPAPGVKVQKFTALSDDIALAMRAPTVRIVAPIPGKNRVGIEVPNDASASVYLKEVLTNSQFRSADSKLMMALGKDISGKPMIANLEDMPHLLIAGTTGSGKTVCINGIIASMLFNASPDEVKFVMVDPKMVELAQYNEIPHLLCPTVTETLKAAAVLGWVVSEMENRYKKLSKAGVRTIKEYNKQEQRMPYIVVIIDELADLMQVSAKTVESSITRLAQLSRAVGIHLILATQRPSVDVITGVIKANFPARISFKVASKVDSRTVLDMNGAESLLGKGDMLFIKPGVAKPTRGQCSYMKDSEIQKVIDFIKKQQKPIYDESIIHQQKTGSRAGSHEKDEFYDEAVRLVIETNQASVSILQRRMRLGYTRAARLIDMMEQGGVVGPYVGSKPRDIIVDREQWLLDNMQETEDER